MPEVKRTIRIKKVFYVSEDYRFSSFMAVTVTPYKRGSGYKDTNETDRYYGFFGGIFPGDVFEVSAQSEFHQRHGRQYRVLSYHRIYPGTIKELEEFLVSRKKGIGRTKASILLKKYGVGIISEIEKNPNVFDSLGISEEKAQEFRKNIIADREFEGVLTYLQVYKLDYRFALPLFNRYRDRTISVLKTSPYSAYIAELLDYPAADTLFLANGGKEDDINRIAAAVLESLRREQAKGSLCAEKETLKTLSDQTLAGKTKTVTPVLDKQFCAALKILQKAEHIGIDSAISKEGTFIYLKENLKYERGIAEKIRSLQYQDKRLRYTESDIDNALADFQREKSVHLTENQKDAVHMALLSPVGILTGGPGTGKSLCIGAVLFVIRTLSPMATVQLAAPTGKAANRMEELCGERATTIHRMLGLGSKFRDVVGENELRADFVIVDEFSMADAATSYQLFRAISSDTRVLLVGDDHQLPSIGAGAVLEDMIDSGSIAVTTLTTVFRQAGKSLIIRNAHGIMSGKIEDLAYSEAPGGDFYFRKKDTEDEIRKEIVRDIRCFREKYGIPSDEIQVLSPLRSTALGADSLNELIREEFNPTAERIDFEEKEFRLGDKVIHTANNYVKGVFNGETGVICGIRQDAEEIVTVEYPDKIVGYTVNELAQLELAYAISVHRAQGGEYPVVIMPVHGTLSAGLNRRLIYTACTRAKRTMVFVGNENEMRKGCEKDNDALRVTMLEQRLRAYLRLGNSWRKEKNAY